jgi:hypothetical protein
MKTELVLFGKRLNLATRAQRRRLVVIFYGIFAALLLASWALRSNTSGGWITIEFAILVGPMLGGHFAGAANLFGRTGLVEPFTNRKTLKYPGAANVARPSSLLRPVIDDDPSLRVDERTLRRRDYAYSVSHRVLGSLLSVAFILDFMIHSSLADTLDTIGLPAPAVDSSIYFLLQIAYVSFLTLPQAILLWSEPDMDEEA